MLQPALASLMFGFVLFVVVVGSFVFAQDTGPDPVIFCPNLTVNMQFGATDATTGGQVTELQRFLVDQELLNVEPTGFFGVKTRGELDANGIAKGGVRKFQCDTMRICSGSESTTGWGRVGPATRAAIRNVCGAQTTNTTPPPYYPPQNQSCSTPWGTTLSSGSNVIAFQSSSVTTGQQCTFETRFCTNGSLSGTYQYASCSVATATCTPEAPQTQTLSCLTGQTGSIVQTRYSACPGPTWGAWTTTANTCTTAATASCTLDGVTVVHNQSRAFYSARTSTNCSSVAQTRTCTNGTFDGSSSYQYASCTAPQATNVGACTYKGASVPEGTQETLPYQPWAYWSGKTALCDNGTWVYASDVLLPPPNNNHVSIPAGQNICVNYPSLVDYGCPAAPAKVDTMPAVPRHGRAPLTTEVRFFDVSACGPIESVTVNWGDGKSDTVSGSLCYWVLRKSHTYVSPGTYQVTYVDPSGATHSLSIRVDAADTTAANNSSQLANALTALQSALQTLLKLLGQ